MEITDLPVERIDEAVALWQECGLTRPWNDPHEDARRAVSGSDSTVLTCLGNGELLGTAMVGHDGHRGWVYYLAVRADGRGHGLGRSLVRACEQWVAARGIPKVQLMVRTGNEPVLAFYAGLGYEQSDVVVLGRRLDVRPPPASTR